jgi:phage terminase large subunit-like protein
MTTWQPGIDYATSPLDKLAIANGCYFDQEAAERVERFFCTQLVVPDGRLALKKFNLLPWQSHGIIRPLYGWKRADGTRRYKSGYVSVAKKNGKSLLVSGLALYHLVADCEASPYVALAANDREQAGRVHKDASAMVRSSPELAKYIRIGKANKKLFYDRANGELVTLSREAGSSEGGKFSAVFFDELHTQANRDLWDALESSGASRLQPLMLSITTAGSDRTTICYEQYKYAKDVLSGKSTDWEFLAYVAEVPEDGDWTNEDVWKLANPSLGSVLSVDEVRRKCGEAKRMPAKENTFRQRRLNQWTQQANRWIPMIAWDKCRGQFATDESDACWCGLDLARNNDIAAFVRVYPREDGKFDVRPHFWVSEYHAIKRETDNKQRFDEWVAAGFMTVCQGSSINFESIAEYIIQCAEQGDIMEVAYDPRYAALIFQLCDQEGITMVEFAQTMSTMGPVAATLLPKILDHKLVHDGNPVLRWMADNVATHKVGDQEMMSKVSSTEKIDGMQALGMGLHRAVLQQSEPKATFYENNALEIG